MYDTTVTVVGNALNTPEWRRLGDSDVLVARFKVATTSRRYDRQTERWVDGASLRVRVNCWRRLGENVRSCVHVGDPLIITGRLYSREWEGDDHVKRISYELDAVAVGHDLARGRGRFARQTRAELTTSAVEDDEADTRVGGEPTVEVADDRPRNRVFDDELGAFVTTVDTDHPGPYGDGGGVRHAPASGPYTDAPGDDSTDDDLDDTTFDPVTVGSGFATADATPDWGALEQAVRTGTSTTGDGDGDQSGDGDDPAETTEGGDTPAEEPSRRRRRTKVGAPA